MTMVIMMHFSRNAQREEPGDCPWELVASVALGGLDQANPAECDLGEHVGLAAEEDAAQGHRQGVGEEELQGKGVH